MPIHLLDIGEVTDRFAVRGRVFEFDKVWVFVDHLVAVNTSFVTNWHTDSAGT